MIDPSKILITCKIKPDNQDNSNLESVYLFKSLLLFGGKLSKAKKIACYNEDISSDLENTLHSLGVLTNKVSPINEDYPHANKIGMLESVDSDIDYVVALGTDLVVVKDFSNFINGESLRAKPVDGDPLDITQWKKIFDYYDIPFPKERYRTDFHYAETIPYFNSDVLIIPKNYVTLIYLEWKKSIQKILHIYSIFPELEKNSFFTDQFALTLAICKNNIPHNILPLEMNFPTHIPVHESVHPNDRSPYLLHYHHLFSQKKIKQCFYPNINKIIDRLNEKLVR